MATTKRITILRAGGGAETALDLLPKQTADQVIALVVEPLGLSPDGTYRLLGPDGAQLTGNIYDAVKDGDKLTLAPVGYGGVRRPTRDRRA